MTSLETEILNVLDQLDASARVVKSGAPRQPGAILPLLTQLDEMTARLPRDTDPQLLHFLHKKSYQKAREYLQGRHVERNPNCDGE